jgi:hypothetical protein
MTSFHKPEQSGQAAALPKTSVQRISLRSIRIDGGTQSRAELNNTTVEEYTEAMLEGDVFPPILVFFDGASYWLADGFHRHFGAEHAGLDEVEAEVRQGTQQDAQLFSFGVNASHGLRRTNADKRKAVTGALQHPVSGQWSDRQIAKHCGVGNQLVGDVRRSICVIHTDTLTERTVTRNGTTYQQSTSNIGKRQELPPEQQAQAISKPLPHQVTVVPPPPSSVPTNPWSAQPAGDSTLPEGMTEDDFGPSPEEIAADEAADKAERELVAKIIAADDVVAELAAEVKRLLALNEALNRRIDSLLNEKADAIQWMKKFEAQNRRLLKEVESLKKGGAQ